MDVLGKYCRMRIEIKFDRGGIGMKYLIWLVGGIAALDQEGKISPMPNASDVGHGKPHATDHNRNRRCFHYRKG